MNETEFCRAKSKVWETFGGENPKGWAA